MILSRLLSPWLRSLLHWDPFTKSTHLPGTEILVALQSPPLSWYKLNTDGSPGRAGCGGVIRDCSGSWVGGFARHLGISNNFIAECWGLRDGLELALSLNIQLMEVEVGCSDVVDLLNSNNTESSFDVILSDCRILLSSFQGVSVKQVFREANGCADSLAKHGASMSRVAQLPSLGARLEGCMFPQNRCIFELSLN